MLRSVKNFLLAVLVVTLAFHWYDGFKKIKAEGKEISFWQYVKEDSLARYQETKKFISDLPSLIDDVITSDDKVKRGALNRLADGLELYKAENDFYPDKATDLIGRSINKETQAIFDEKGFSYSTSEDRQHFKISIPLKNGEMYTIER